MMKATVEQLQEAIARERAYQVAEWGDRKLTLAGWLLVAESELDEAIEAWVRGKWDKEAKAELLQFVTAGHRWLEQEGMKIDGKFRKVGWKFERGRELEGLILCAKHYLAQAQTDYVLCGIVQVRNDGTGALKEAIVAGMMALLQHGIVERGEL
jgi:hypothetical protein